MVLEDHQHIYLSIGPHLLMGQTSWLQSRRKFEALGVSVVGRAPTAGISFSVSSP